MFAIGQRASRIAITRQTVVLSRYVAAIARRPGCRARCALPAAVVMPVAVVVVRRDDAMSAKGLRCFLVIG
jgi:hypothetical protein